MDTLPAAILSAIRSAGQEHVLRFWDSLDGPSRTRLAGQLEGVDWPGLDRLRGLARGLAAGAPPPGVAFDLAAAETPPCTTLDGDGAAGESLLAGGLVGAILVAGGQGSRLGCAGPKGTVAVGPLSGDTLFERLLGKLGGIRRRYGRAVPLAIMTSTATDAETRAWLAAHGHCGLDPTDVLVFRQRDLPALDDRDSNLLLEAPDRIALAPDGHGGLLPALVAAGGLGWFADRGCRHVVTFQVDNPLTMPLHPGFLGAHLRGHADFTTQVVRKREPQERVGVVVRDRERTFVVEYSDLPPHLAAERRPDGELRFHAGSIAVHAFALDFLARAAATPDPLPLHLAHKAVPFVDADGTRVQPRSPNAVKFERFVFDLMPLADRVVLVEIDPADGFAPLKNPPGAAADTLAHVHAAMDAFARRLLARAGVAVAEGVSVELAPWILDERDVGLLFPRGKRIDSATIVGGGAPG